MSNLYRGIPADLPDELFTTLCENGETRVERIVSRGHRSPEGFWYDQPQDEFVLLLQGAARLEFDDQTEAIALEQGDWLLIRAHRRHRVAWTADDRDTVWLAVHLPAGPASTALMA